MNINSIMIINIIISLKCSNHTNLTDHNFVDYVLKYISIIHE